MDRLERLSHSTWECKYHVVFIPKRRARRSREKPGR
jgi:REP element-mobilizing transposase RayT